MIDLVEAGFVKKSFGAEGLVKLALDPLFKKDFSNCDYIFIELDGSKVPFYITKRDAKKDIISLEDIVNPEEANKLSNKKVYLERSKLSNKNIHSEVPDEQLLVGFSLNDSLKDVLVGTIKRVEKFPQQIMLIVQQGPEEIMIPLTMDWIINIDAENQLIEMELPEGIY